MCIRDKFIVTGVILILLSPIFITDGSEYVQLENHTSGIKYKENFKVMDKAKNLLSNTPTAFTENRGQLQNNEVRFYNQGGSVWFTDDGMWFELREEIKSQESGINDRESDEWFDPMNRIEQPEPRNFKRLILKQEFVGANQVRPIGVERLSWNSNFFYGNESEKWCTDIPNYSEIFYENLYDGIDLRYYSNKNGLKYDFIVHSDSDIHQIKMKYQGAEQLRIDNFKNLIVKTSIGNFTEGEPFIYQAYENSRYQVDGKFIIYDNMEYGFNILNKYNTQKIMVIDPQIKLEYSTYVGGDNWETAVEIAVDDNKNVFITGKTNSSNFPTTNGAYDTNLKGSYDVFVMKLNANGSTPIYSTFIGGLSNEEGVGITLDSNGNAFVSGNTGSSNFPIISGSYDNTFNGTGDGFILKLNPIGSVLIYSTFIGGDGFEYTSGSTIDAIGNAFVVGGTDSSDFPTTSTAFDTSYNGGLSDVFVIKLDQKGSSLIYSTYIGGTNDENMYGYGDIAIDPIGNAIVTGSTRSSDFPITQNAYDNSHNGGLYDVFVLKLNQSGSSLIFSTFIGGTDFDESFSIISDSFGNTIVAGRTASSNFPTTPSAFNTSFNGILDAFVLKLNKNGSKLIFSTFIGGSDVDEGIDLALDCMENIYLSGETKSQDFPITQDAFDKTFNGTPAIPDGFMLKLDQNCSTLLYSTYIGGNDSDFGASIAVDHEGSAYICGQTESSDFHTTPGAYDSTFNGMRDSFILKIYFPPVFKIISLSLLKDKKPETLVYSRLYPYTFRINITDTASLSELRKTQLNLDPLGINITLVWDRITRQFTKVNDPNDYIILETSSKALNNSKNKWTLNFNVTFNWNYPDENFHDVQAYATSATLVPAWFNATNLYCVENDLVFIGNLSVKGEDNFTIQNNDLIKAREKINWSGLKVIYENTTNIYPPTDEYDVTIWNEGGLVGVDSPSVGNNFTIHTVTGLITDIDGDTHIINLSGIPPECDKTNELFTIRIDGDNVTFSKPIPNNKTWQTSSNVNIGITISDIGGAVVNGSTIMRTVSNNHGTTWSNWESISGLSSLTSIDVIDSIQLEDGIDNFVKWCAEDSIGNGPTESEAYQIIVDTKNVTFSEFYPQESNVSYFNEVELGLMISDNTSGVNASSIEYAISTNGGDSWTSWTSVPDYKNRMNINVTLNLTFLNGTSNRIKWRASDIAGNGPIESDSYKIRVNTWQPKLRVRLLSPGNRSIIQTIPIKLDWMLENRDLSNVTFDLYLDIVYPPIEINQSGLRNDSLVIDFLSNRKTYYWMVIPRIGTNIGSCVSGIWSFTIEIPIPSVTLQSPLNNSILTTLNPTLSWMVEYYGTEKLNYSVFLDIKDNLDIKFERNTSIQHMYTRTLQDGETYYWKVVPWVGNIRGQESKVWSFTIDLAYIPKFELDLTLDPTTVQLEPGEITVVKANVTNLGELTDSIILNISGTQIIGVWVSINEPSVRNASYGDIAEFTIAVVAMDDAKTSEMQFTIIASSGKAAEYGINYEKEETLKIFVLGEEKPEPDKDSDSWSAWIILIIVIMIILVVLILILLRRKKQAKEAIPGDDIPLETPIPEPVQAKLHETQQAIEQPIETQTTNEDEQEE